MTLRLEFPVGEERDRVNVAVAGELGFEVANDVVEVTGLEQLAPRYKMRSRAMSARALGVDAEPRLGPRTGRHRKQPCRARDEPRDQCDPSHTHLHRWVGFVRKTYLGDAFACQRERCCFSRKAGAGPYSRSPADRRAFLRS